MADCISCGVERADAPLCPSCGQLQPLASRVDLFSALGLERKMGLERSALDRAFRERSKQVHPDRFPKDAPERRLALAHTERVNQAYKALKDARLRAEHLLELSGAVVAGETERTEDPEFLMAMLEKQEAVEAADEDRLEELADEAKRRRGTLLGRAEAFFDQGQGDVDEVKRALVELRYVRRLLERIEARFEELN